MALKKNDSITTFYIKNELLKQTNEITFRFSDISDPNKDLNFIFLHYTLKIAGENLLDRLIKSADLQQSLLNEKNTLTQANIEFNAEVIAPDLKIKRLTAVIINDMIEFTLVYSTQKERFMSFYNPPSGDRITYTDWHGLNVSDTVVRFYISRNLLKSVEYISMRFSTHNDPEMIEILYSLKLQIQLLEKR
ncbi:MAG: hypothetical protein HC905_17950 [Bacteroidales bacterium]|nr:hypothetical protein [Bacteroidales bacterium]